MSQLPLEIVVSPAQIYLGPTTEAWPDVDDAPVANWALLATVGYENYAEEGVHILHNQETVPHFTLGSTGPMKMSRTQETLSITVIMHDLDPDETSKGWNANTVTSEAAGAATGGYDWHGLTAGLSLTEYRMLVRIPGESPLLADANAQFEIERVVEVGSKDLQFAKGNMVGLQMEFMALEDPDASTDAERFGRYNAQDAEPTG
jgi:hypothetical protein